jgi:copper chaperone NosL
MPDFNRRHIIALLLAGTTFGCSKQNSGTEEIHYGRETCAKCGMVISDPRFAAEIRGGPQLQLAKFDDAGCAANWLETQTWRSESTTQFWVMNSDTAKDWLQARSAFYLPGQVSPMNYGFAAISSTRKTAVDFAAMRQSALAKG